MFFIYKFTNKINGKCYVGSTNNIENRRRQHLKNSIDDSSPKYKYPLYCAFRKYGIDNFDFEIIGSSESKEQILLMEKNLIIEFNGLSPNGYNQTLETFSPMRDEAIVDKLRDTKRQKCGKRVALIENNSIKKVWNSVSECAEDLNLNQSKIVSVCGGKRRTTGDKIFRYLDEKGTPIEVKYDPQPSLTRVTKSSRKVLQLDLVTKEVLNSFDSLQIAANHAKCDQSGIAKVCNGKRKSCGGYCWMYVDN